MTRPTRRSRAVTYRCKPETCGPDRRTGQERRKKQRRSRVSAFDVLRLEVQVFQRVCQNIDTPRSLACWLLAEAGEWQQYLELTFPDPLLDTFGDDYLVTNMFKKSPNLPIDVNRREAALAKFRDSEELCRLTNDRMRRYTADPYQHIQEWDRIYRVRRYLVEAVGPLSRSRLTQIMEASRFGPGATSVVSGSDVLLSKKYASRQLEATPRLVAFVRSLFGPHAPGEVVSQPFSNVTTVPKNAMTDRTICIEPHCNVFLQLGIGTVLKNVMQRLGLQPRDQERNRRMAQFAVKNGYATIDLSMASDTISSMTVLLLLPDDWFHLLHVARTDWTKIQHADGTVSEVLLEKFSSMGNGYTWELESLIFWAIARSHTEEEIGVFGDDLVVPCHIVPALLEDLEFFGFKVNDRKSFWQGDFRESCGTDWWRGCDVRPYFFTTEAKDVYALDHYAVQVANGLRLYAHRRGYRDFCDSRFLPAWLYACRQSGQYRRTFISAGYGDDGLVKNLDEARPSRSKFGLDSWRGVVARRRPLRSDRTDAFGAYLAALHRGTPGNSHVRLKHRTHGDAPEGVSRLIELARGRLGRPRTEVVPVSDWYHLGPWL